MSIENTEREGLNFSFDVAVEGDLEQIDAIDNRPEEHAEMLKLQKEGAGKLIVARRGDKIAGYVFVYFDHQSAHFPEIQAPFLEDLMVHPDFRQKGLGKELLQKCEEEIRNQGGEELTFAVLASNQQAIDFYIKNDYERSLEMDFKTPTDELGYYFKKGLA